MSHLSAGDLRQCDGPHQPQLAETSCLGEPEPLANTSSCSESLPQPGLALASDVLQQLTQRVADLEADNRLLKQQKQDLEQKNEELMATQSESQTHEEIPRCSRCAELERQQAEIASDFSELEKLCKMLFSSISTTDEWTADTKKGAALASKRMGFSSLEVQRLRLGGRFGGAEPPTLLSAPIPHWAVPVPTSTPTPKPAPVASTEKIIPGRLLLSQRMADSLRARYKSPRPNCLVCTARSPTRLSQRQRSADATHRGGGAARETATAPAVPKPAAVAKVVAVPNAWGTVLSGEKGIEVAAKAASTATAKAAPKGATKAAAKGAPKGVSKQRARSHSAGRTRTRSGSPP